MKKKTSTSPHVKIETVGNFKFALGIVAGSREKLACPDHMRKSKISSTIIFECTDETATTLRVTCVKMAAIRFVEIRDLGRLLRVTRPHRRTKLSIFM